MSATALLLAIGSTIYGITITLLQAKAANLERRIEELERERQP